MIPTAPTPGPSPRRGGESNNESYNNGRLAVMEASPSGGGLVGTSTIIAAVARNRAIGYRNKLLYWLPDDMRRFRQLTTGHTILMGRRTFESLPKGALPNRRNCVLTCTVTELPGCECFSCWEDFVATCREDEEVFIIGGASIYAALIDKADRLCLTEVDDTPEEADAFFPDYSYWHEVWREHHPADDRHSHAFDFVDYCRCVCP